MALSGASFRSYVFLSICLSGAVVGHAAFQKRFFYRTMVYLGESKLAFMAVANLALVSVMLVWKAVQKVFLGPLRFREVERLNTRARDAIIECCFATTIFRDEVNLVFLALVTTLLMLKSLHWLAKDRMDFLEEQPLSPRTAHMRLVGFMGLLFVTDSYLVWECAKTTFRTRGGTMLVLFAFEFTVLLIELCSDFVRYIFHAIDLRMEGRWDSKGLYSFYNELVTDMCQLTVYLAFFLYVHTFYTFPLHILREVYLTFSKFQRRCSDFLRYRRVVSTMNELFADATEEDLAQGDRTCIICREEMTEAKKLACGHMFHARCLQSWLKRQLSCPTCRTNVDVNPAPRNNSAQQAGVHNNVNVQPPVGGAVPPPPDDVQQAPGFWDHARRLWRHVAFGAPRDGGPEQPVQPGQPNQQGANPGIRGQFLRRLFPNVRVGFQMGQRPREMGQGPAVRYGMVQLPADVQLQPGAHFHQGVLPPGVQIPPLPPGVQLPPGVLPPGVPLPPGLQPPHLVQGVFRRVQPRTQGGPPQHVPNAASPASATPGPAVLRTPPPNARPIDQLIVISENLANVRRQVDLLRNQVQELLVQATEQAVARQTAANAENPPNVPTTAAPHPVPNVATDSVSPAVQAATTAPTASASSETSQSGVTETTPAAGVREALPENLLSVNEPSLQSPSPVSSVVQTEEERLQEELRARRLAFLGGKSKSGGSSSSASTSVEKKKDEEEKD